MKRVIAGVAAILAMVTLSTAAAGEAANSNAQRSTAAAHCEKVATGHADVTAADLDLCRTSSVTSGGHCPPPSTVLIVRVKKRDYALRRGHKPSDLGPQPGMGTYSQACGFAGMPATAEPLLKPISNATAPRPLMPSTTTTASLTAWCPQGKQPGSAWGRRRPVPRQFASPLLGRLRGFDP